MSSVHSKFAEHRLRWQSKPALRAIYEDFHRQIIARSVPGKILEIGSGSGHISEFAEDVIELDILWAPWLDVVGDAQRLPFADASFDNIVMLDVLHHIERPALFLREARRVLRPGGRIVVVEPAITPLSYWFYRFVHEEDVDLRQDPLATAGPAEAAGAKDAWDSNQALPTLMFARRANRRRIERLFPELAVVERRWYSLWAYPLSGGFQRWSLIPAKWVRPLLSLERRLLGVLGPLLGFRMIVVLQRRGETKPWSDA